MRAALFTRPLSGPVVLFALGLMAKPMLVTLPFVLLLLDYWPLRRFARPLNQEGQAADGRSGRPPRPMALLVEKIPLFALAVAFSIGAFLSQRQGIQTIDTLPLYPRVANALVSYLAYLGQFFWPVGLAALYPHPGNSLPPWEVAGAFFALLGISVAVLLLRRRHPHLLVGWLWYLGMMVPVIGLVQVGSQGMACRYTYLPQIGLCVALAWAAARLIGDWPYRGLVWGIAWRWY